jgi:hypothetical protein
MIERRKDLTDTAYEPPEGDLEKLIATVQTEVLDLDLIGRGDNYFDLGGTSLQAMRICTRIQRETGYKVIPAWLFEDAVLSDFARRISNEAGRISNEGSLES